MPLTEKEQLLLDILAVNPFVSQQDLADRIALSRSATANLLSGLQDKGFIQGRGYVLNNHTSIICIGAANWDHKLQFKENFIPQTSNPVCSQISIGGVIYNVAENLSRLGLEVSLMTLIGDDLTGEQIVQSARPMMQLHATDRIAGAATGSYIAVLEQSGGLMIGLADMDICERMDRGWMISHRNHLQNSRLIVADCNVHISGLEYLIEFARLEQKDLAMIGVSAPKMKRLPADLRGLYLGVFNRDETQTYFQTKESDVKLLAKLWIEMAGLKQVIVTAGADDFAFGDSSAVSLEHAVQTGIIVDVTGAGDAFSSGVIYGLLQNRSLQQAVRYGAVNAAETIGVKESVRKNLTSQILNQSVEEKFQ